jgi:hypothetical protein
MVATGADISGGKTGSAPGSIPPIRRVRHRVVEHDLPEGTVPAEPDSLALELHVGAPPGRPIAQELVKVAAKRGLRIGTSDVLLL